MTDWENSRKILYPLGVTLEKDGAVIMAQAEGTNAALLLYEAGGKNALREDSVFAGKPYGRRMVPSPGRQGYPGYGISDRGGREGDKGPPSPERSPGAKHGATGAGRRGRCAPAFPQNGSNGGDDKNPRIPYSDTVLYRLHVRGFTMHPSSGVKHPGTFSGVAEKIPYLKALGVTLGGIDAGNGI